MKKDSKTDIKFCKKSTISQVINNCCGKMKTKNIQNVVFLCSNIPGQKANCAVYLKKIEDIVLYQFPAFEKSRLHELYEIKKYTFPKGDIECVKKELSIQFLYSAN